MGTIFYLATMFVAKVFDNLLSTSKTILVQRGKSILAGVALGASQFIYFSITKNVVSENGYLSILIVSIASGVGCCLAVQISDRLSKDRTYVNVIMSSEPDAIKEFGAYLAQHKISNVITDSYTLDWEKSLTITAYAETKAQSKLIDQYINDHDTKFKRFVQNERVRKQVEE